ncbi:MAG: hypothetical protein AAFV47_10735 [Pseudomonadota bacterium]
MASARPVMRSGFVVLAAVTALVGCVSPPEKRVRVEARKQSPEELQVPLMRIELPSDSQWLVGGQIVGADGLAERATAHMSEAVALGFQPKEVPFVIAADQEILETTILEVMFVLQRSGVTNVAFEIL